MVYNASAAGVNAANLDMVAATEADFSQRNSHYVFTEDYDLLAAALVGASVTRGRFQAPHWNALAEFAIVNANRALQPPANPQWDDYRAFPIPIPRNEEFQVQTSNNLGASTEIENCVLQIAPRGQWGLNIDRGQSIPGMEKGGLFWTRTSFTVTPTLNAWSGPQALTFQQQLRGGLYGVVGGMMQGSNSVAWRLVFPRMKLTGGGRKLRPGNLIQNAVGDQASCNVLPWKLEWGPLAMFHTFEPVQAEVFGTAASSTTYQLFLSLVYMGESRPDFPV